MTEADTTVVGDHVRPTDGEVDPGVYRVVGTGETVTLLRVADGDGRRVHSGAVCHVDADGLDRGFEPAENPDAGFSPVELGKNLLQGMYWSVRRFF